MNVEKIPNPIDIAVSGMRAQDRHMEVISSNIANARTVDDGKGQAYRRLETVFRAENEGISSVTVDEVLPDSSPMQQVFDPGNPRANASGYVTMPNVLLPVEMMNLGIASKAYQANAAVLKRYQKMIETTLELLR
jgi:flagellar basal-body rod protein FlgC